MKITSIKKQQKRNMRYSVFVDGEYSFSLSESGLLNAGLRLGQEITSEELNKLKENSSQDKAYARALDLIARRPRSEWEMRDYLKRKGYDSEQTIQVITKLAEFKYLDDADFARRWVANRRLLKATSKRKLQQELRQKRISDQIINQVLEQDETDDKSALRDLIERKRRQTKYQDNQKLMQYLSRQGFNYGDIKEILDE